MNENMCMHKLAIILLQQCAYMRHELQYKMMFMQQFSLVLQSLSSCTLHQLLYTSLSRPQELVSKQSRRKCWTHSWRIALTLKQFRAVFPQVLWQLLLAGSFRSCKFIHDQQAFMHCTTSLCDTMPTSLGPMTLEILLSSWSIWVSIPRGYWEGWW